MDQAGMNNIYASMRNLVSGTVNALAALEGNCQRRAEGIRRETANGLRVVDGRCQRRAEGIDLKIQDIMTTLREHTNYLCTDEDELQKLSSHSGTLKEHEVRIGDNSEGLQSLATVVEGNTKTLKAHDDDFMALGHQTKQLRERVSTLEALVAKQQTAIDTLNGVSKSQKAEKLVNEVEKFYNEGNKVWNRIAKIENSALKVLAYIGYVLASILTLGILPAVDLTSKSFDREMTKHSISPEGQARLAKFDELNRNVAKHMMNQTPAQENLERLLDAKEKNDPKATKEAIEAAELAVKNEIQKIDASLAAHKAEINADMKKVNERIFARKKAKAEKAKVKDEKHAKLKEAAAKRRDGARAGEPRAIAANKAKEAEAKAKAEAEAAKPAAPVQAPAA